MTHRCDKAIEELRERAATFVPVEGRAPGRRRFRADQTDGHRRRAAANRCRPTTCSAIWAREETLDSVQRKSARGAGRRAASSFDVTYPGRLSRSKARRERLRLRRRSAGHQGKEAARAERRIRQRRERRADARRAAQQDARESGSGASEAAADSAGAREAAGTSCEVARLSRAGSAGGAPDGRRGWSARCGRWRRRASIRAR